jgi:hypothetical protein
MKPQTFKFQAFQFVLVRTAAAAVTVLLVTTLVSCTHAPAKQQVVLNVPPSPCANIDWHETGRLDGRAGSLVSKLTEYQRRCDKTDHPVETDLYENGRESGLIDYCSATGGLEAGKSGLVYQGVCPENLEPVFLTNFQLGSKIHELESENSELESRMANLKLLMPPSQKSGSLANLIEQLKTRHAANTSTINDLESSTGSNQSSTQ